jgi:hypothetical protein
MNEEKDQQPQGSEKDFSELAKHSAPKPTDQGGADSVGAFLRGCGMAIGIVALVFFFIVGACFMRL